MQTKTSPLEKLKRTPPTTDELLWQHIHHFMGYDIPRHRIKTRRKCHGHCPPFSYVSDAYFERVGDTLVWACRTGGKTLNAAILSVLEHAHKPRLQRRILGGSEEQSKRMYEHVEPFLLGSYAYTVEGKVEKVQTRFQNGGRMAILAASPTHVLGHHIPRLDLDEIDEFDPAVLEKALGTSVSQFGYRARIDSFSTFHNPYGVMHETLKGLAESGQALYKWCIFEVLEHCGPDYDCKGCVLYSDCQGVAERDIPEGCGYVTIEDARRWKRRHSREGWESFYLCERPFVGGLFYKRFDEDTHVSKHPIPYNPNLPLYRGFDFGTNDPTHVIWAQVEVEHRDNPNDERETPRPFVRIIDEWREFDMAASDAARQVAAYHKEKGYGLTSGDYGDPSGRVYIKEYQKHGIFIQGHRSKGAKAALNSRMEGHEIVRQFLCAGDGKSSLIVSKNCLNLVRELQNLHYPKAIAGRTPPEDHVQVDDHGADALRYFFAGRFPQTTWQFA